MSITNVSDRFPLIYVQKFSHLRLRTKCLITVIWIGFIKSGILPRTKHGFYCDDPSIGHKYNGDTVSTSILLYSILVPFFIVTITETLLIWQKNKTKQPIPKWNTKIWHGSVTSIYWYAEYFIGMMLHMFFIEALKLLVSELRPHFLDTCKPDAAINCSLIHSENDYITNYNCTNKLQSAHFIRDSSKSFPSGHSSISFFEAIFLILYFKQRLPINLNKFTKTIIYVGLIGWAIFCAGSRIIDHRHHWWDVLIGANIGLLFGILTAIYLCKNFKFPFIINPIDELNGGSTSPTPNSPISTPNIDLLNDGKVNGGVVDHNDYNADDDDNVNNDDDDNDGSRTKLLDDFDHDENTDTEPLILKN